MVDIEPLLQRLTSILLFCDDQPADSGRQAGQQTSVVERRQFGVLLAATWGFVVATFRNVCNSTMLLYITTMHRYVIEYFCVLYIVYILLFSVWTKLFKMLNSRYTSLFFFWHFYRAMHVVLARYCYRKSSVSLSVCLSVTLMYHWAYRLE